MMTLCILVDEKFYHYDSATWRFKRQGRLELVDSFPKVR
jgi:hypothetical protein